LFYNFKKEWVLQISLKMLDNNSNLIVGGNNLPSFFASILQPDLINRFLVNSKLASGLLDNKGGIWRAFVTLSISLPFQNLLLFVLHLKV